jgi:hypothetical protein
MRQRNNIRELTKAALAAAKARGVKPGSTRPGQRKLDPAEGSAALTRASDRFSTSYKLQHGRQRLAAMTRQVAGLALREGMRRGREQTRDMTGEYMKRINTALAASFGFVSDNPDSIEKRKDWIVELEGMLLRGEFPSWL